jgi:cell wall assembly regulator SMI1
VTLDRLDALVTGGLFKFVISTSHDPDVDWASMGMADPATSHQIEECEGALGLTLPAPYRAFLERWNGGHLWQVMHGNRRIYETIHLFGTEELVYRNLRLRGWMPSDFHRGLLWFGRTDNRYHLFDLSTRTAAPAVVGGGELDKPHDWLRNRVAESFTDFLKKLLDSDGGEFWLPNNRAGLMQHVLGVLDSMIVQAPYPAQYPNVGRVTVTYRLGPGARPEELARVETALGFRLPGPLRTLLTKWNGADLFCVSQDGQELWNVHVLDTSYLSSSSCLHQVGDGRYLAFAASHGHKFLLNVDAEESPVYFAPDGPMDRVFDLAPSLSRFLWTLQEERGRRFWVGP